MMHGTTNIKYKKKLKFRRQFDPQKTSVIIYQSIRLTFQKIRKFSSTAVRNTWMASRYLLTPELVLLVITYFSTGF